MEEKEWFADWFDTSFYHILYQDRNEAEAKRFIDALLHFLKLPNQSSLLDLACGKGRHALTLHEHGHDVLGVDLSKKSILHAKKFKKSGLDFAVHDMREVLEGKSFDAIFNLFTSFGYFDSVQENEKVCKAIFEVLKPGGRLVIDFMNAEKVIDNLVLEEHKLRNSIDFEIARRFDGSHIIKDIRFSHDSKDFCFTERVQAINKIQFLELLEPYFVVDSIFGSFALEDYIPSTSDRLIIIATRK